MSSAMHSAALAAALLACAACSGGAPSGPLTFPADAYLTTTSDSGSLRIELRSSPQPPTEGTNAVELTVTDASSGKPRDGLAIAVSPFMPAMGHGSVLATGSPEGNGKYLLPDVYLFMPGTWLLRTSFTGAATDHAAPTVDIP